MTLHLKIRVPNWLDLLFAFPLLAYRRFRFGYPFRKIRLTDVSGVAQATCPPKPSQGEGWKSGDKFAIIDPADFYWLSDFLWLTVGKDDNFYAARVVRTPSGRLNTILMHKEILPALPALSAVEGPAPASRKQGSGPVLSGIEGVEGKAPLGLLVDHRNTDLLDNRRANLRLATHSQNSCNSRRDKSNTLSRYRGVSFSKRKQKWFAAIRANGKKMWLGYFDSEEDAARAYDAAASKYHKEFARLNFSG